MTLYESKPIHLAPFAAWHEARDFGKETGHPYEINFDHITWTYWVRWPVVVEDDA